MVDPKPNLGGLSGLILSLENRAARWLENRRKNRLMNRFGGIQRCPWCRQIAQDGAGWSFQTYEHDQSLDVLTCGVCGGTSLWLFSIGMIAIAPLSPPSADPSFPNRIKKSSTQKVAASPLGAE